jgi:hypothetical protein
LYDIQVVDKLLSLAGFQLNKTIYSSRALRLEIAVKRLFLSRFSRPDMVQWMHASIVPTVVASYLHASPKYENHLGFGWIWDSHFNYDGKFQIFTPSKQLYVLAQYSPILLVNFQSKHRNRPPNQPKKIPPPHPMTYVSVNSYRFDFFSDSPQSTR